MYGIAAVVAVLAVSLIAFAPMAQEAKANAANKNGFASSTEKMTWGSVANGTGNAYPMEIESYYFKTSNDNNWLVDFTAECGTANHVKAEGKKGSQSGKDQDLTSVSTKVFFVVEHPDDSMWLVNLDGSKQQYLQYDGVSDDLKVHYNDIPEEAMWNLCSQQFDLQVNLNDLIVDCKEALTLNNTEFDICEGDENQLVFLCSIPVAAEDEPDECAQSVEIFLENAGTRTAKAVLMDLPHGDNGIYVYGMFAADGSAGQFLELSPDGLDKTSTWVGKRILILDTFHTDQSEPLP